MSGGEELSENQPAVSHAQASDAQPSVAAMIRAIVEECAKNPQQFVEDERVRRGE